MGAAAIVHIATVADSSREPIDRRRQMLRTPRARAKVYKARVLLPPRLPSGSAAAESASITRELSSNLLFAFAPLARARVKIDAP